MSIPEYDEIIEPNDQTEARRAHLEKLRELIGNAYPNKYDRSRITGAEDTISNVLNFEPIAEIVKELRDDTPEGEKPNPELKENLNAKLKAFGTVRISGRLAVPPRVMGKAAFVHLSDGVNRLQIYVRKQDARVVGNDTSEIIEGEDAAWDFFKLLDHGDFVGASGFLFLTNTGELSVHVETLQFLSKALVPMPDKMHGIADPELRRRYRYADLIASSLQVEHEPGELTTREVFERRAKLISGMRRYLDDAGYIEVETPMLTPKATGAAARAFETHHNALDIPLYARIAPELYLKRLTVGGFERVYELNRNFRNEGLSQKHNPEFTMLEFYCAYMDVNGMMDFSERMIQEAVKKATGGSLQVKYGESETDFSRFERISMKSAVSEYVPRSNELNDTIRFEDRWIEDNGFVTDLVAWTNWFNSTQKMIILEKNNVSRKFDEKTDRELVKEHLKEGWTYLGTAPASKESKRKQWETIRQSAKPEENLAEDFIKSIIILFENFVEQDLGIAEIDETEEVGIKGIKEIGKKTVQPTFIIDYPKSISPLSKASPANPNVAERFELFINGMECANGFSELNDPQEQYERFVDQMKERETGDEEAMVLDEDYIRALAYGMPPAAGIGIGIDRLVMLLTNKHSIRDVILFPHMRPERREEEKSSEGEAEK